MSNINTKKYRVFLAQQFANSVANTATARLYVGIGRVAPWTDDTPTPPTQDPQSVDFAYWRDSIGFKRVANTGISLVVPRVNWTYGTIYNKYDDQDASLFTKTFFVLDTSGASYRVYKCLWNGATVNNPNGVPSITAPSVYAGESAFPVQSPDDGYVWQYLYGIDPLDDFLTNDWMPVYTDAYTQAVANTFPGRLPTQVPLVISSPGANYDASKPYTLSINGDGSGAMLANTTITVAPNGTLSSAYLSMGGQNYTRVESITVSQPAASQAALRVIIPPTPNHGYDPVHELGASAVMLRVRFAQSEHGKLTTDNDYRRIFLVQNPTLANGQIATDTFYKQTYDLTLTDMSGTFTADTGVVQLADDTYNVTATVVDVITEGANTVLRVTDVHPHGRPLANTFVVGDIIQSSATPTTNAVIAAVRTPELTPYSGSVLYVEHHSAITRSSLGEEDIKLVFNFG